MVFLDSRAAPLQQQPLNGTRINEKYWMKEKTPPSGYKQPQNQYWDYQRAESDKKQPLRRQFQPFPLSLPQGSPKMSPRGLPRQSSPIGVYQNVPTPIAAHSASKAYPLRPVYSRNEQMSVPENSYHVKQPIQQHSPKNGEMNGKMHRENVTSGIWTTKSDPTITQIRHSTPPHYFKEKSRQSNSSRSKPPRWGRWMQSFCCCMAPQQEIEPVRTNRGPLVPVIGGPSAAPTSTTPQKPTTLPTASITPAPQHKNSNGFESLITQVNKDGTITVPLPTEQQQSESASIIKAHQQAHQLSPNGSPVAQISQGSLQSFFENLKPTGDKLLLPPLQRRDVHKKCLIIDLDETLVHSSFKPVKNPDFVIPVEIDGIIHQVYVLKRPFVDEFLEHVGDRYECVLFTASLAKYADPVADLLDKRGVFRARLFREACVFHKGNYVKDLARLGRDLNKVLIMDNSPASYAFHPENAIAVQTWFDDPHDSELLEVLPLLDRLVDVDSVYTMLRQSESPEPRSDRSSS